MNYRLNTDVFLDALYGLKPATRNLKNYRKSFQNCKPPGACL